MRSTALEVDNHPLSRPVISGPHQERFFCRSKDAGLGPALDENCRFEPTVQWFARLATQNFVELDDPYSGYPPGTLGTQTADGRSVPWVVRVETRAINRGIARIAVLDDPSARGADAPFEPVNWSGGLYSAGLPTATFADIPSTAMTVADCGLLEA